MTTTRLPLLLGEQPSKAGDRYYHFPLSGAVGKRLCELAGIPPEEEGSTYGAFYWALRERFDCVNAIERWSARWDAPAARERVWAYLERHPADVVVALGRRAANAVGLGAEIPWGEWQPIAGMAVTVVPHPSGRNLVLNDPETRALVGRVLREAAGLPVAA